MKLQSTGLADAYNEVAYVSDAQTQTHPDRLATVGRFFGLDPADVRTCRVLELGCGSAGGLQAAALSLPAASFVGFDLAEQPIKEGIERTRAIGLENVELRVADIVNFDAEPGGFDYIIAHGVYSWVPAAVQDRLLELCRKLLAPQGIAYVSYNVLPGWHLAHASREMMRYQMAQYEGRERQLREARGLLAMLSEAQTRPTAYAQMLAHERERLEGYPDWFLVHDHVADYNEPLYVSQFIDRARQHQLRFLAEADFHSMHPHGLAPWVADMLLQADTPEMREQYLDFFRGRTFRRTLLCHTECVPEHQITAGRVRDFLLSCPARQVSKDGDERAWAGYGGRTLEGPHPFAEAVLHVLEESWPERIAFSELKGRMAANDDEEGTLERFVFDLYRDGFLDLHTYMPDLTTAVEERPVASPLVRLQVQRDTLVTSLLHRNVVVEDANARRILALLDGTNSVEDLKRAMPDELPRKHQVVQDALHFFARSGLLMA